MLISPPGAVLVDLLQFFSLQVPYLLSSIFLSATAASHCLIVIFVACRPLRGGAWTAAIASPSATYLPSDHDTGPPSSTTATATAAVTTDFS